MNELVEGMKMEIARLYGENQGLKNELTRVDWNFKELKAVCDFIRHDKYASQSGFKHIEDTVGQLLNDAVARLR